MNLGQRAFVGFELGHLTLLERMNKVMSFDDKLIPSTFVSLKLLPNESRK